MKKHIFVVVGILTLALTASAGTMTNGFQSTSAMTGSGSIYASNPSLSEDGTATYNSPSYGPARTISGPHYIPPVTPTGDPTPVGDEILPLLLLAMGVAVAKLKIER